MLLNIDSILSCPHIPIKLICLKTVTLGLNLGNLPMQIAWYLILIVKFFLCNMFPLFRWNGQLRQDVSVQYNHKSKIYEKPFQLIN